MNPTPKKNKKKKKEGRWFIFASMGLGRGTAFSFPFDSLIGHDICCSYEGGTLVHRYCGGWSGILGHQLRAPALLTKRSLTRLGYPVTGYACTIQAKRSTFIGRDEIVLLDNFWLYTCFLGRQTTNASCLILLLTAPTGVLSKCLAGYSQQG